LFEDECINFVKFQQTSLFHRNLEFAFKIVFFINEGKKDVRVAAALKGLVMQDFPSFMTLSLFNDVP